MWEMVEKVSNTGIKVKTITIEAKTPQHARPGTAATDPKKVMYLLGNLAMPNKATCCQDTKELQMGNLKQFTKRCCNSLHNIKTVMDLNWWSLHDTRAKVNKTNSCQENAEQLETRKKLRCRYCQSYIIGIIGLIVLTLN